MKPDTEAADWRITVVVDDQASGELTAEHGLSLWIESDGYRVLFDTGQGAAIATNSARLGVPLEKADAIVLSHGHNDHTGGVSFALGRASKAPVYIHPLGFESKYTRRDGATLRAISMPDKVASDLLERDYELSCGNGPRKIGPGVHVTGEIPRRRTFEDTSGAFFLDASGLEPDRLRDDQALYLESPRGIIIVLGCAHSGAVNTLEYVSELTGGAPVCAVLGGMHLLHASDMRIERTADAFVEYGVEAVAPCHCTGVRATARLRERLGVQLLECHAGATFDFGSDGIRCGWNSAAGVVHSPAEIGDLL